jgi:putative endonuclease
MQRCYHTYIVASRTRCVYIGVTGDIVRRMGQHKGRLPREKGFSSHYRTSQLVYYEMTTDVNAAIAREKQLKGWTRARKIALIASVNPAWRDLARAWPEIVPLPEMPLREVRVQDRDQS